MESIEDESINLKRRGRSAFVDSKKNPPPFAGEEKRWGKGRGGKTGAARRPPPPGAQFSVLRGRLSQINRGGRRRKKEEKAGCIAALPGPRRWGGESSRRGEQKKAREIDSINSCEVCVCVFGRCCVYVCVEETGGGNRGRKGGQGVVSIGECMYRRPQPCPTLLLALLPGRQEAKGLAWDEG